MRKTLLAYMAGIIDGEGCLTIAKQIRKNRPSPSYRSMITVSNTDKRLIDLFVTHFGGVGYFREENRVDKKNVKWADGHTWYCKDGVAVDFLKKMIPFLILKKRQAKILLEFQNQKSLYKRKSFGQGLGSKPLSKKEIEEKEKIYLKIKSLNKKGLYSRSQN